MSKSNPIPESESDEPAPPSSPYAAEFGLNAGWVEEIEDQYRVDARSSRSSWRLAASSRTLHATS